MHHGVGMGVIGSRPTQQVVGHAGKGGPKEGEGEGCC